MKERSYTLALFLALTLLFCFDNGYAKNASGKTKSTQKTSSAEVHIVRQGESLYRIALKHNTTPALLLRANKLKSDKIKVGQKITIPGSKALPPKPANARIPEPPPTTQVLRETFPIPQMSANTSPEQDNNIDDPLRYRLVKAGFETLGIRYRKSGGSEESGFDCSGLVKSLFARFNIELPRSSREQFLQGEKVERDKLQAGDLVFFSSGGKRPTHVGIYIGDNKFLHAAVKARQVIISDLDKIWYTVRYLGARRVMDLWSDDPSSTSSGN
jgi:peptidoglycan DL-endopeptidase LytE